jgi:hypothetical protein
MPVAPAGMCEVRSCAVKVTKQEGAPLEGLRRREAALGPGRADFIRQGRTCREWTHGVAVNRTFLARHLVGRRHVSEPDAVPLVGRPAGNADRHELGEADDAPAGAACGGKLLIARSSRIMGFILSS